SIRREHGSAQARWRLPHSNAIDLLALESLTRWFRFTAAFTESAISKEHAVGRRNNSAVSATIISKGGGDIISTTHGGHRSYQQPSSRSDAHRKDASRIDQTVATNPSVQCK